MLAVRWEAKGLAADDPARGFAISRSALVLAAIETAAGDETIATPGRYLANHQSGRLAVDVGPPHGQED